MRPQQFTRILCSAIILGDKLHMLDTDITMSKYLQDNGINATETQARDLYYMYKTAIDTLDETH